MECPFFCVGANGSYTTLGHNMFFILQTIFPTAIFHFQFSIFHLMNLSTRIRYGGSPYWRIISPYKIKTTVNIVLSTVVKIKIFYFAKSDALLSRIILTLICPGYSSSSSIFLQISLASGIIRSSFTISGLTITLTSRPA